MQRGASRSVPLTKRYQGDEIKKNEIGWECSTYGGGENLVQGVNVENVKERVHFQDLGVGGRIILKVYIY